MHNLQNLQILVQNTDCDNMQILENRKRVKNIDWENIRILKPRTNVFNFLVIELLTGILS